MNPHSEIHFDEEYVPEDSGPLHIDLAKASSNAPSKPKLHFRAEEPEESDEPEGQLTVDVYQTPTEIVVESAVAGVDPDKDLDIDVTADSITIRGRRQKERHIKHEDYFYQECYWGRFSRSVILPQEIDAEHAHATFKNGVLSIHLPKLTRQKAKKVRVRME
ncbi:MAG: Hsp20/alpha crystallin family protein [Patescibacteria group bacterium]